MPPHFAHLSFAAAAALLAWGHARPGMSVEQPTREQTCGQEMAASAEVPQKWQELMDHVATNMEGHARWVGTASPAAKAEHDAMMRVAAAYREMAAAGGRAATAMRAMKELPPAPHDPARMDRQGQAGFMRAKIQMQRAFAALLIRHVEESEKALAELEAPGPTP
jgi:hypothetical protein